MLILTDLFFVDESGTYYLNDITRIKEALKTVGYSCSLLFRVQETFSIGITDADVLHLLDFGGNTSITSKEEHVSVRVRPYTEERYLTYSFDEYGDTFAMPPQEWDTIYVEKLGCKAGAEQLAEITKGHVKKLILREDRSEAELQSYLIYELLPAEGITIGTLERDFQRSHISSLLPAPSDAVKFVDVRHSPLANVTDAEPGIIVKRRHMPWTIKRYGSFSPEFYERMLEQITIYVKFSRERGIDVKADTILAMLEHAVQEEDRERKRQSEEQQEGQERKRPAILF